MSWWSDLIPLLAQVGGTALAAQGSEKAADRAAEGSEAAVREYGRQFDLTRSDLAPYMNIGRQALGTLGSMYGYSPTAGGGTAAPAFRPTGAPINALNPSGEPNNRFMGAASGAASGAQFGGWPGALIGGIAGYALNGGIDDANPLEASGFTGITMDQAWQDQNLARLASNPAAALGSKLGIKSDSFVGKLLDPSGIFNKHGDEKRNLKAFLSENDVYDMGDGNVGLADGTIFPKEKLQEIAGHWYGATYAPDGNQAGWQQSYNSLVSPYRSTTSGANVGQAGGGLTSDGVPQGIPAPTGGAASLSAPDYSAFFKSPDYEFRRSEGLRDVGNAFSASGGAKSGNALKALAEFNSNLAAGGFNDYFKNQLALAGIGTGATNTSAQVGANTAANVGNALMTGADARASGVAGKYNAISSGLSDLALGAGYMNALRRKPAATQAVNWGYGRVPQGSYA